jgi:hypothetical protein
MGNGFELRQNQEVIQEKKVQILCRCVSVDSTGYVFADMNLKKKGGGCSITLNVKLVDNEKRFQTYFVGTFFKLNYV